MLNSTQKGLSRSPAGGWDSANHWATTVPARCRTHKERVLFCVSFSESLHVSVCLFVICCDLVFFLLLYIHLRSSRALQRDRWCVFTSILETRDGRAWKPWTWLSSAALDVNATLNHFKALIYESASRAWASGGRPHEKGKRYVALMQHPAVINESRKKPPVSVCSRFISGGRVRRTRTPAHYFFPPLTFKAQRPRVPFLLVTTPIKSCLPEN